MLEKPNTWALVLAAGEGSRLRSLTTPPSGPPVPKQFCSLHGGPSLLDEALCRAQCVAAEPRTCVVVAEQHRCWWQGALRALPAQNVVVQPSNRGTAIGILLPLLHILSRDPAARLVLLPSDHHVREEGVLTAALRGAVEQLEWRPRETLLLGLQPEEADPELGYILPGHSDGRGALTLARFVEKPSQSRARELIGAGGLWNAFIVASSGLALLELFRKRIPGIVDSMAAALQRGRRAEPAGAESAELAELYQTLPAIDFSRDIVAGNEGDLRVLPVRPCGWSDLGTPKRVSEVLRRTPRTKAAARWGRSAGGYLSLAEQQERLRGLQEIGAAAI
jgi:mannose-1-phosphate guanylyltransferase